MIPVLTTNGFRRLVTIRQGPAEIAGKVLRPIEGLWRTAERAFDPKIGDHWFAFYFKPKAEQIEEWNNRAMLRERPAGKVAH